MLRLLNVEKALKGLLQLAEECKLDDAKEALFSGASINKTEKRAVLHHALRNVGDLAIELDGRDVMPEVNLSLAKMQLFTKQVLTGQWKGYPLRNQNGVPGFSDHFPVYIYLVQEVK